MSGKKEFKQLQQEYFFEICEFYTIEHKYFLSCTPRP